MDRTRKKGQRAMMVAVYILLFTWIVLLALLIAIYVLRLHGYENFTEWKNQNKSQTVLQPQVVTPYLTGGVTKTPEPSPTKEVEVTLYPTSSPQITMFSGNEAVDRQIWAQAELFFEEGEELCYMTYEVGVYFSVVLQRGETILPLVYHLKTGEQLTGSDVMKETYFAIIKERLQTYVAEQFPEEAENEFVSYEQTYQVEDYQKFYITEDQVVFYFEANTLTDNHGAFSYGVELEEAKAFFHYDLLGAPTGHAIRELDPEKKMIAITFDDGPYSQVEDKLLALLEANDAKATFFFLGQRINDWFPDTPGSVYAAGHEVASHTYSHTKDFSRVTAEEMWTEINQTNLLIAASTGYAPDYVRFPGGTDGKRTKEIPMVVVNWNVDSVDYAEKNKEDGAQIIFERLKKEKHLGDGSVVLLHSIYENSYEAAAMFIPYLKEQGYELVTLSELFYYKYQDGVLDTGIKYYDGFGATTAPKQ